LDTARVIEELGLEPHPAGGYYREIYRAPQQVRAGDRVRSASTSIYFLLPEDQVSAWHVVQSDEQWHYYAGSDGAVLELHLLGEGSGAGEERSEGPAAAEDVIEGIVGGAAEAAGNDGGHARHRSFTLGRALFAGQVAQAIVPAGVVQAARPIGGWVLMGCTVAPGFDFADFRLNTAEDLHRDFPAHREIIDGFF
jgi:predicted cupin superfamily sugar epimerase